MADPLHHIAKLLDDVEFSLSDHAAEAHQLLNEAERVGSLVAPSRVQRERLEALVNQAARLRESATRQRAILRELRQQLQALRHLSS